MGARNKLNGVYVIGCFIIAGILGLLTGSGGIFVLSAVVLVVCSVVSGDIRFETNSRHSRKRK